MSKKGIRYFCDRELVCNENEKGVACGTPDERCVKDPSYINKSNSSSKDKNNPTIKRYFCDKKLVCNQNEMGVACGTPYQRCEKQNSNFKSYNDFKSYNGGKITLDKTKKLIDTFKKVYLVKIAIEHNISLKTKDKKIKSKLQLFNSLKRKKLI